jgi:hypothetical protein
MPDGSFKTFQGSQRHAYLMSERESLRQDEDHGTYPLRPPKNLPGAFGDPGSIMKDRSLRRSFAARERSQLGAKLSCLVGKNDHTGIAQE